MEEVPLGEGVGESEVVEVVDGDPEMEGVGLGVVLGLDVTLFEGVCEGVCEPDVVVVGVGV